MPHESNLVVDIGPDDPLAFFNISVQPPNGALDAPCPVCKQHGEWNAELDTVSMRCRRAICDRCLGFGWVELGDDAIRIPDIVMSPEGYPMWIVRYIPCR